MRSRRPRRNLLTSLFMLAAAVAGGGTASAQNYSVDARNVAMGGVGDNSNIAASMVEPAQTYRVIPVPLGLIQVFQNRKQFIPGNDEFNPVQAISMGSSPLHYTFGRDSTDTASPEQRFINDLVNGRLSRDLSTYRGFQLPADLSAKGLASGGFGKTIKFAKQDSGAFHGIYVGAGPYLSFDTTLGVDQRLIDILDSDTALYFPSSTFRVDNDAPFSWRCRSRSAIARGSPCRGNCRQAADLPRATESMSPPTTAT